MAINYEKTALTWYENAKKLGIELPSKAFFQGLIYQYKNGENTELIQKILSPLRGDPSKQIVHGNNGDYFRPIQLGLERINKQINADRKEATNGLSKNIISQIGLSLRDEKVENISAKNMNRRLVKSYYVGAEEGYSKARIKRYLESYRWIVSHYLPQPWGEEAKKILSKWSDRKLLDFILSNEYYDYDGLYLLEELDFSEFVETLKEYE